MFEQFAAQQVSWPIRLGETNLRNHNRLMLPNDGLLVARGRKVLQGLARVSGVPDPVAFDAGLCLGEALANVQTHAILAVDVDLVMVVDDRARQIKMGLRYLTRRFNPLPPEPDWTQEHGRGIRMIREFCRGNGGRAAWLFSPAGEVLLGRRKENAYWVTVLMFQQWATEASIAKAA